MDMQPSSHSLTQHTQDGENLNELTESNIAELKILLTKYFELDVNPDVLFNLCHELKNHAFCFTENQWCDFVIVTEMKRIMASLDYTSVCEWLDDAKYLPNVLTPKQCAKTILLKLKIHTMKTMLLSKAKEIHRMFYEITLNEIDDIMPFALIDRLSIEEVEALSPLVDHIMMSQSQKILLKQGFSSWSEWQSALNRESLSNDEPKRDDGNVVLKVV